MSPISVTEAQQQTIALLDKTLAEYTKTNGEPQGRTLEAFLKAKVFARAVHGLLNDLPEEVRKPLAHVIESHMTYQMSRYFDVLDVDENAVAKAFDQSESLLEQMQAIHDSIDQTVQ